MKKFLIYEKVISEWDWDKNSKIGLNPRELTFASNKKAWWKCSKGHSFYMQISKRTTRHYNCPYCSGSIITHENSFGGKHPHLLDEWDFEKNEKSPYAIAPGSEYKAWWKCPNGHSYQRRVYAKVKSQECPICKGFIANIENCLATTNPELLREWDFGKNKTLNPNKLLKGSHKEAWWICPNGHSYKTRIYVRSLMGCGCPQCDAEKRTSFPEQAIGFYLEKYTDVLYRHKIEKIEVDVYLPKLSFGIEYDGSFYHKGSDNEKREHRKNDFLNSKGILLIRVKENKSKKITLNYEKTNYGYLINTPYTQSYLFIKGVMNTISEIINKEREINYLFNVNIERDRGLIIERYSRNYNENSVTIKKPIGIKKWDYSKNGNVDPNTIPVSSKKKFFWKCPTCGYEWEGAVENLTNTTTCVKCVHSKAIIDNTKGYSLVEQYPNVLKEWDYNKNQNLDPKSLTPGSNKKAWWKYSKCGFEWESPIKVKVKGHGCPQCGIQRARESKFKKNLKHRN